jgi:heat shock protein HslJ
MTRTALGAVTLCAGILLGACTQGGGLVGPEALAGQAWTLETVEGQAVAQASHDAMTIGADGELHGRYGCATITGRAVFDSDRVTFQNLNLSAPDCSGALPAQATRLMTALGASDRWSLQDRYLLLFREGSTVPSRLQRQQPMDTLLADQPGPAAASQTQ